MTHGQPDDANIIGTDNLQASQDMAELAARMGSIVTFDRGGLLLWATDMAEGVGGFAYNWSGAASEVTMVSDYWQNGGISLRLIAGQGVTDFAYISKLFPRIIASRLGFAVLVSTWDLVTSFELQIRDLHGVQTIYWYIKYIYSSDSLWYLDSSNVWQLIAANIDLARGENLFHYLKAVIDFKNQQYCRLIVNQTVYDLSGITAYTATNLGTDRIEFRVLVNGHGVADSYLYVDAFILTQNEG